MTRFSPNEWVSPKTIEDAVRQIKDTSAIPIAGGTGIYELAKRGNLPRADVLVDLSTLGLEYARIESGTLRIGSMSRFSWLLNQNLLSTKELLGLKEAIANVKPVQVRNAATVGGAVSISIPFLDFPPAALCYDTTLVIAGSGNKERQVPVSNFWLDYLLPDLKKGEIITELRIKISSASATGSAFLKIGRTAGDFALVNVCAKITLDDSGKCKQVSVALGGVSNTPIRARDVETSLIGQKISLEAILKAVQRLEAINPVPSVHGSSWYKKEIAKVLVRDALITSTRRAGVASV